MSFELHPQLAKDTTVIGEFPLSLALLHKDNAVPWVILVLRDPHFFSPELSRTYRFEASYG